MTTTRTIIILVHGTFAPGARWTRQLSPLVQTLRAMVLPASGLVIPFGWSGQNNHREREAAADELTGLIVDLHRLHPDARFLLIGHSHGGNVCLLVAARRAVSGAILGTVCLATPFLVVADRKEGLKLQGLIVGLIATLIAFGTLGYLPYSHHGGLEALLGSAYNIASPWLKWPAVLGTLLLFPLALVVVLTGGLIAFNGVTDAWEKLPKLSCYVARKLRLPAHLATPVLWVRYRGDEAAAWLRLVARITSFPFSLWNLAGYGCLFIALLYVAAIAVLVVLPFRAALLEAFGPSLSEVAGVVGGALLMAWIAGLCLSAIAIALISSRSIGFGSYLRGASMLVSIKATVDPPKSLAAKVVVLGPWEAIRRLRSATGERVFPWPGVVHSIAYRDPVAIELIARWVGNLLPSER